MVIIGIDPGVTTGIAGFNTDTGRFQFGYEFTDMDTKNGQERLEKFFNHLPADAVFVCEDFRLYPRKAQQLSWSHLVPAQVIGMVRVLVGEAPLYFQPASAIKKHPMTQDVMLGQLGAGEFGRHAKDAARHAVLWACKNDVLDALVYESMLREMTGDAV